MHSEFYFEWGEKRLSLILPPSAGKKTTEGLLQVATSLRSEAVGT